MTGYANPPIETRFKKGHKPVSNGRPKGSRNWVAMVEHELNTTIAIKEGGTTKQIAKKLVIVKKLLQNAISGKSADIKTALDLINTVNAELDRTKFDDNAQTQIDIEIIKNHDALILSEHKEVEI